MDLIVEFNESAFRHNISREDILHAIKTNIYTEAVEVLPVKYISIGFDRAGNPLEIMYNPVYDNTITVFHAMKARKGIIASLGL